MAANTQRTIPEVVALQNKDRVIAKVLEILKNEKIGSLRNMFAKYTMNGSQFVFKTPERLIPSSYQAIGGNKSQYGKVGEVTITPDQSEIVKFVEDRMDWSTEIFADEEINRIAGSIVLAIDGQLDAEILSGVAIEANKSITYIPSLTMKGPQETAKEEEVKALWRRLSFGGNALKGKVTANSMGVSNGQLFHLVSNNLMTLLVEHIKVFTDKAIEMQMEGSECTALRVGNQTVITHPFLGQTFPAGSLHERKSYDFAKVHCITMHSEAFAMAFNRAPFTVATIDPDTGNTVFITRYQFGSGILRPAFITENGIAKDATDYGTIAATGTGTVISANITTTAPNTKA